jgi:DNA replication and repair protein RecF
MHKQAANLEKNVQTPNKFGYLCLDIRKNMPVLEKIVISDFRNIHLQELDFSPNINCISGNNGEGKTNLLDAIYYLSMTKSAFSASDKFNFRHGTEEFSLSGAYRMENGLSSRFALKMNSRGEKKVRRDDKQYPKVSDHIGALPIVMVSPADISMISDSGEERRRFANAVLSQMDREYMSSLQQYNRLLLQRNRMLKGAELDLALLEVMDMRMSALAEPVYHARKRFIEELKPIVSDCYQALSGGSESIGIEYDSELSKASLEDLLASSLEKDRVLKYTSSGIQRDDFIFTMNGHPIRRFGSQGQQKSFLVALKFAQYEIMKRNYGFAPILLLDDVFDKLDMSRISNLLQMVASNDFGQIFITDSNKVRMSAIVDGLTQDRAYFETAAGSFTRI